MTDIELALLRSLAISPIQTVSSGLLPTLAALHQAGYIAQGPSGWLATERGCVTLEQMRPKAQAKA